jgi:hypothetical protein
MRLDFGLRAKVVFTEAPNAKEHRHLLAGTASIPAKTARRGH